MLAEAMKTWHALRVWWLGEVAVLVPVLVAFERPSWELPLWTLAMLVLLVLAIILSFVPSGTSSKFANRSKALKRISFIALPAAS